jgi:hypothetical protein
MHALQSIDVVDGQLNVRIEEVGPDRLIDQIERVLQRVVGVQLVALPQEKLDILLLGVGDHYELDAC